MIFLFFMKVSRGPGRREEAALHDPCTSVRLWVTGSDGQQSPRRHAPLFVCRAASDRLGVYHSAISSHSSRPAAYNTPALATRQARGGNGGSKSQVLRCLCDRVLLHDVQIESGGL